MLPEKSSLAWVKVSSLEGVMASLQEQDMGMSLVSEVLIVSLLALGKEPDVSLMMVPDDSR